MDGILLKIPVLCMTASFTKRHLGLFQKLSGFKIVEKNTFWCGPNGISRRSVCIQFEYSRFYLKHCKKYLQQLLSDNVNKKAVVYHNTAKSITSMKDELDCLFGSDEGLLW